MSVTNTHRLFDTISTLIQVYLRYRAKENAYNTLRVFAQVVRQIKNVNLQNLAIWGSTAVIHKVPQRKKQKRLDVYAVGDMQQCQILMMALKKNLNNYESSVIYTILCVSIHTSFV